MSTCRPELDGLAESIGLWSVLSDTGMSPLLVRVDRRERVLVSPVVKR